MGSERHSPVKRVTSDDPVETHNRTSDGQGIVHEDDLAE